jgi:hypothetical protein
MEVNMHLDKEGFEFGNGDEVLKLIFTPEFAKDLIRLLEQRTYSSSQRRRWRGV